MNLYSTYGSHTDFIDIPFGEKEPPFVLEVYLILVKTVLTSMEVTSSSVKCVREISCWDGY